jgi:hypothetical protein
MNRLPLKDLMMVGSARAETAEQALTQLAETVGSQVSFLPDGETGERRNFIMHLARRLYLTHPDMEIVSRPAPQDGLSDVITAAGSFNDIWSFKVRDGIDAVKFGQPGWRLGYAEPAAASYFVFKTLREKGLIPPGVRFQVTLPAAGYGCYVFVPDPGDWPKVVPGYEAALRAEIAKIADLIPNQDLVIQFDQIAMFSDAVAGSGRDSHLAAMSKDRYRSAIANVGSAVPEDVLLGYHLCYGGFEGWPTRTPPLTAVVAAANLVAEAAGRRIDYIHLPLLAKQDEDYFKALSALKIGAAKLYLGVIHGMDDAGDFRFRIEQARKYAPDFGIAAPCGTRALALPEALEMHKTALGIF